MVVIEVVRSRGFLVIQWQRIHLPMQETGVRSLVREDPTGLGATKPLYPHILEPGNCNDRGPCVLEPVFRNGEATAVRSPSTATREQLLTHHS